MGAQRTCASASAKAATLWTEEAKLACPLDGALIENGLEAGIVIEGDIRDAHNDTGIYV